MSVRILLSSLTREKRLEIARQLTLEPNKQTLRRNGRTMEVSTGKPVSFYEFNDHALLLPLHYAQTNQLGPFSPNKEIRQQHPWPAYGKFDVPFQGALRPQQQEVMEQASKYLKTRGTCLFEMYPGFGKTCCSIYQITQLKHKALVIVHRVILAGQWVESMQKYAPSLRVLLWNSKTSKKPQDFECDVIVSMDTCVQKLPEEVRSQIGTLVMDEAHLLCTFSRAPLFFSIQPKYFIACSATISTERGQGRMDGMERMIDLAIGKNRIFVENPCRFELYPVTTPFRPYTGEGGDMQWHLVNESLALSEQRNELIVNMAEDLVREGRKVLILTFLTSHIETLETILVGRGLPHTKVYRTINTYEDAPILLGSMSKISVGFDEENACENFGGKRLDTLIVCVSTKQMAATIQEFGRVFRTTETPRIYYLIDHLPVLRKHFNTAKAYALREHQGETLGTVFADIDIMQWHRQN